MLHMLLPQTRARDLCRGSFKLPLGRRYHGLATFEKSTISRHTRVRLPTATSHCSSCTQADPEACTEEKARVLGAAASTSREALRVAEAGVGDVLVAQLVGVREEGPAVPAIGWSLDGHADGAADGPRQLQDGVGLQRHANRRVADARVVVEELLVEIARIAGRERDGRAGGRCGSSAQTGREVDEGEVGAQIKRLAVDSKAIADAIARVQTAAGLGGRAGVSGGPVGRAAGLVDDNIIILDGIPAIGAESGKAGVEIADADATCERLLVEGCVDDQIVDGRQGDLMPHASGGGRNGALLDDTNREAGALEGAANREGPGVVAGVDAENNAVGPHLVRAGRNTAGSALGSLDRDAEADRDRQVLPLAHADNGDGPERAVVAPADGDLRDHLLHHLVGRLRRVGVDLEGTDLVGPVLGLLGIGVTLEVVLVGQGELGRGRGGRAEIALLGAIGDGADGVEGPDRHGQAEGAIGIDVDIREAAEDGRTGGVVLEVGVPHSQRCGGLHAGCKLEGDGLVVDCELRQGRTRARRMQVVDLDDVDREVAAIGVHEGHVVAPLGQLATAAALHKILPANLGELSDVRSRPDNGVDLIVAAPGLHRSHHGRGIPVGAVEVRADEIPHDRGGEVRDGPVRCDDAGPARCAVQVVVAGGLLRRPDRLAEALAQRVVAVGGVVQADDVDGRGIRRVLGDVRADLGPAVLRDDLRVREAGGVELLAQQLDVRSVRGALVPDTDVVNVEIVDGLGALEPQRDVCGGQIGLREGAGGATADPARERPRKAVELDVRVALLGLDHEPPLIAALVVQVIL
eukprot:m.241606 g.241606  ORF g.241606 m.241606 type:complete len:805 (-) comp13879_c0_seq1:295-2709(-)